MRLLVFPLVVVSQRHTVKMNNNMPQIQAYQEKITEARLQGNPYESKLFYCYYLSVTICIICNISINKS